MATKYVCDRCSFETTNNEDIYKVEIPVYSPNSYNRGIDSISKDLCQSCVGQLNKWIEPLPKNK